MNRKNLKVDDCKNDEKVKVFMLMAVCVYVYVGLGGLMKQQHES